VEGDGPSPRPARWFGWFVVAMLAVLAAGLFTASIGFETIAESRELSPPEIESGRLARIPAAGLGLLLAASAVWIGAASLSGRIRDILRRTAAAHVAIYLVLLAWFLPTFNAAKTYKPQGLWLRDQMGQATHFGLMYPEANFGFRKMGAFGYYSGKLVRLLDDPDDVDDFFRRHPDSVALIYSDEVEGLFADDPEAWRARVVRDDLYTGSRRYVVIRGPR
jgi:hypothetical protein